MTQLRRLAARFNTRCPATIRSANLKNLRDESRRLRQIYNQAWEKNWGFVPFTEAEIQFMTNELKPLLVPEFAWVAEIGDEPVGFTLCLPDINVVLTRLNGRLTRFGLPIGLIKLLLYKRRVQKGRLIALGVVEKYRRAGIAEMLVLRVMEETMVKRGITGELSMTLEDNFMINRFLEAIGESPQLRHSFCRISEPPRVPILCFRKAAALDQVSIIRRIMCGQYRWRKLKPIDQKTADIVR